MSGATPTIIPELAQEGILQFHKQCYSMLNTQWNIREQMRQIDLSYIRENDWTATERKAKVSNRYGDPTKFQNVTVPVVMPQVEAAVTYQASVFLTGVPLFGWVAPPNSIAVKPCNSNRLFISSSPVVSFIIFHNASAIIPISSLRGRCILFRGSI